MDRFIWTAMAVVFCCGTGVWLWYLGAWLAAMSVFNTVMLMASLVFFGQALTAWENHRNLKQKRDRINKGWHTEAEVRSLFNIPRKRG